MATQTIDPRLFLKARLRGFTKDIRACSTVDPMTGKPAFFPGLITCFSMLELLSGLYSGDISNAVTIKNILKFRSNFLNYKEYSPLHIRVLHSVMRHKVAHLGHPYYVTDTRQEHHFSSYANHMRITWVVSFSYERPVIEIKKRKVR